ncbi:TPA: ATP-binding protein [Escherichia coli]|nr:ATP-binding protein [Escherichia coli]
MDGSWLNQLRLLQKTVVLILDDLEPLTNQQCNDLLEIVEDRYEQSSTIVIR